MNESLSAGKQIAHSRATVLRYIMISVLLMIGVQHGAVLTTADASANDGRERLIGRLSLLLFIGSGICWLMWQHRAYANLRLIGSGDTEYTPGWSVG